MQNLMNQDEQSSYADHSASAANAMALQQSLLDSSATNAAADSDEKLKADPAVRQLQSISACDATNGLGMESPMVITPMALVPTLSRAAIAQSFIDASHSVEEPEPSQEVKPYQKSKFGGKGATTTMFVKKSSAGTTVANLVRQQPSDSFKQDTSYQNHPSTMPLKTDFDEQIYQNQNQANNVPHHSSPNSSKQKLNFVQERSSERLENGATFHTVDRLEESLVDLGSTSMQRDVEQLSVQQPHRAADTAKLEVVSLQNRAGSPQRQDEVIRPPEVISVLDNGTSVNIEKVANLTDLNSLQSTSKLPTKVQTTRNNSMETRQVLMNFEEPAQANKELNRKKMAISKVRSKQRLESIISQQQLQQPSLMKIPIVGSFTNESQENSNSIQKSTSQLVQVPSKTVVAGAPAQTAVLDPAQVHNSSEFQAGSVITVNLSKVSHLMPKKQHEARSKQNNHFVAGPVLRGGYQQKASSTQTFSNGAMLMNTTKSAKMLKLQTKKQQKSLLFKNSQQSGHLNSLQPNQSPTDVHMKQEMELFIEQNDRLEKIKGNLKLLNQIMQHRPSEQQQFGPQNGFTAPFHLPLPNHNYVQRGSRSISSMQAAPTKIQYYPIQPCAINQDSGSQLRSVQPRPRTRSSTKSRHHSLPINRFTMGEKMRADVRKMFIAQENLVHGQLAFMNVNAQQQLQSKCPSSEVGGAETTEISVDMRPEDIYNLEVINQKRIRQNGMITNLVTGNTMTNSLDQMQAEKMLSMANQKIASNADNVIEETDGNNNTGSNVTSKKTITSVTLKQNGSSQANNAFIVKNQPSPTSANFNPIVDEQTDLGLKTNQATIDDADNHYHIPDLATKHQKSQFAEKDPPKGKKKFLNQSTLSLGSKQNSFIKEVTGLEDQVSSLLIVQAKNSLVNNSVADGNATKDEYHFHTFNNEQKLQNAQEKESDVQMLHDSGSDRDEARRVSAENEIIQTQESKRTGQDKPDELKPAVSRNEVDSQQVQQRAGIGENGSNELLNTDIRQDLTNSMGKVDDYLGILKLHDDKKQGEDLQDPVEPHPMPNSFEQSNDDTETFFKANTNENTISTANVNQSNVFRLDEEFNIDPQSTKAREKSQAIQARPQVQKTFSNQVSALTQFEQREVIEEIVSSGDDQQQQANSAAAIGVSRQIRDTMKMNKASNEGTRTEVATRNVTGSQFLASGNKFDQRKSTLKLDETTTVKKNVNVSSSVGTSQTKQDIEKKVSVITQSEEATPIFQKLGRAHRENVDLRNLGGEVSTNRGVVKNAPSSYDNGNDVQEFDPAVKNGMVIDVKVSREGLESRYKKSINEQDYKQMMKSKSIDRDSTEYQNTLEKGTQQSYYIIDSQRKAQAESMLQPHESYSPGLLNNKSAQQSEKPKTAHHRQRVGKLGTSHSLVAQQSSNQGGSQSAQAANAFEVRSARHIHSPDARKVDQQTSMGNFPDLTAFANMSNKKLTQNMPKNLKVSKNQHRQRTKQFVLQFNDIAAQQQLRGQDMQIVGQVFTKQNCIPTRNVLSTHQKYPVNARSSARQANNQPPVPATYCNYHEYAQSTNALQQNYKTSFQTLGEDRKRTMPVNNFTISRQQQQHGLFQDMSTPKMMLSSSSSAAMHQKKLEDIKKRKQSASSMGFNSQATRAMSKESHHRSSAISSLEQRPKTVNAKKNVAFHRQKVMQQQIAAGRLTVNRGSVPVNEAAHKAMHFDSNFVLSSNEAASSAQRLQQTSGQSSAAMNHEQYSLLATSSHNISQRNLTKGPTAQQQVYGASRTTGFFQNHKPMSQLFKSGHTDLARMQGQTELHQPSGSFLQLDPCKASVSSIAASMNNSSLDLLDHEQSSSRLRIPKLSHDQMLYSMPIHANSSMVSQVASNQPLIQRSILSKTQNQFTSVMGTNTVKQVCCSFPETSTDEKVDLHGTLEGKFSSQHDYKKGVVNLM